SLRGVRVTDPRCIAVADPARRTNARHPETADRYSTRKRTMRTTLLAIFRSPRLSSIVLVGSATLAACNTDQPVAPKAPEIPAAAQPALLPQNSGSLVIKLVDGANAIIPLSGAGFI